MHKRLINEAIIGLTIAPAGPILIKAAESGADPTRPDMEFVRTYWGGRRTVYLPGSSLKGVIRSHCERIARTVGGSELSCNPLKTEGKYRRDPDYACSKKLEGEKLSGPEIYAQSCFICQMFGNTALAGHVRFVDAYPDLPEGFDELPDEEKRKIDPNVTEERDGVAIDRVFGSVAVGPFQFEVVTRGRFRTTIHVQNFTLAQLGLLGLALRDLAAQQVFIGFGKSRVLGRVTAEVGPLRLRYPPCRLENGELYLIGGQKVGAATRVYGVGSFPVEEGYGYPANDAAPLPEGISYATDEWGEPFIAVAGDQLKPFWVACVERWRAEGEG